MYDLQADEPDARRPYFSRATAFASRATSTRAIGSWVTHTGALSLQVMTAQHFDFLILDAQHGMIDSAALPALLTAFGNSRAIPLVRVLDNEPGAILRALDAGALGIVCPMVNTASECEAFVAACRYAPRGTRSWGPFRLAMLEPSGYLPSHADEVLTVAMIETVEAVANLGAIAAVPGLSALLIGPADLSLSLGEAAVPDWGVPALWSALDRVVRECRARGLLAGIAVGTAKDARAVGELGFDFIAVGSDVGFVGQGARLTLDAFRSTGTL